MVINEVQTEIYKVASALVPNVYDEVDEDIKFPCILIGDIYIEQTATKVEEYKYSFDLSIYSIKSGKKESNAIADNLSKGLKDLKGTVLKKFFEIDSVTIPSINVYKAETCFRADVKVDLEVVEII